MTDYDKLIFIDTDNFFLKGAPDALTYRYGGYPPAAMTNCQCDDPNDTINSGFMILRPTADIFKNMYHMMGEVNSVDHGEQGFLDTFFKEIWREEDQPPFTYMNDKDYVIYGSIDQKGNSVDKAGTTAIRFYVSLLLMCLTL